MKLSWKNLNCAVLCVIMACFKLLCYGQSGSFLSDISCNKPDSKLEISAREKLILSAAGQLLIYSGTLVALNQAWYKDHPRSSFHFYNDMADWQQMDKFGHIVSTYHLTRASSSAFTWNGQNKNSSAWLGAISALSFMTAVEVLDGLSEEWGFSTGDFMANLIGSASYVFQELWLDQQVVTWKYSFHRSRLETYRPDLLGNNLSENLLKDYNGMSFWLSLGLTPLFKTTDRIPEWLNLSIGYGAFGMLGSSSNPGSHHGINLPLMERHRRWYIAPDINFEKIPTDKKWLKTIFYALQAIKMPAPTIEYSNKNGWSFHILFF